MNRINESTPIIATKTRPLTSGQSAIVYLSTTSDIGQLTTVFDVDGFLSSPQSILISTTPGVSLVSNGISTIKIQQRFGYMTLRSEASNRWNIVDENAFRDPSQDYTRKGIQFSTIQTSNMTIGSNVSTTTACTTTFLAQNATSLGPLFVSSVGSTRSTFVVNSLSNTSNLAVLSSVSFGQPVSTLSSASITGPISVQGSLAVGGTFTTLSTMYLQSSLTTAGRLLVNSNINVQGVVLASSNIVAFTNVATSTLVSRQIVAGTMLTNTLFFSTTQLYTTSNSSLYVSSSVYVPNTIQTSTLYLSNISTQTLSIVSSLFAPSLNLPSAAILNVKGSFVVSSLYTNTAQVVRLYGSNATSTVNSISTQSSYFSTLLLNDGLYTNATSVRNAYVSTIFSNNMNAESISIGGSSGIQLESLGISTIVISSFVDASVASSFVASADIFAYNVNTTSASVSSIITSSLSNVVAIAATTSLVISTPGLYTSSISARYISANTCTTSSIGLSNANFGSAISSNPAAPYFVPSTLSGLTSNTPSEYIRGAGFPYDPLHIVATRDRSVAAYISNCTVNMSTAYLTVQHSYVANAPSTTGSASIILKNPIVQSTIRLVSVNAGYQTFSLTNYPIDTRVISSTYTYSLVGPVTYAAPSDSQSQQTLIAGGTAATSFRLAYSSDGGNKWTTLPLVGFENGCYGIAFGGSKWIAVGNGTTNTMIVSYTGTVWYSLKMVMFSTAGYGVAWNGLIWVALGEGTNTLATSSDGITWTGFGTSVFSVRGRAAASATGGSVWVAAGEGTNTLARSADGGATWSGLGSTIFSTAAYGIAWNGSLWVAVGSGTNTLATSPDGITWTGFGSTVFQTEGRAIAWNGSYWLAGSRNDPVAQIAYSTNGTTWTPVSCPLVTVYSLVWSAAQWVATGTAPTGSIATSPNGLTWTLTAAQPYTTAYTVANRFASSSAAPSYVATGSGTNQLVTSTDGNAWTPRTSPFTTSTNCVAWNGTRWVAGGSGTYVLAYSSNGVIWTGVSLANMTAVNAVAWGSGKWIAVGAGSAGYTRAESTDGITWTQIQYTTGGFFSGSSTGIVWAQGLWVATGAPEGSGILYSLDGTNWIPQFGSLFTTGRCVSSNGTLFVAGGTGSVRLAYSLEGSVWLSAATSPFSTQVNGVAWGGRVWVAVGQGTHTIAYSYDGMTWVGLGSTVFTTAGTAAVWTGSGWIATGSGTNTIATSTDGITWEGQGSTTFSTQGSSVTSQIIQPNTTVEREEPVKIRWDLSGVALISPSVIEKPARTNPGYDSVASSLDAYTASANLEFRPKFTSGAVRVGLAEATTGAISFAISLLDTGLYEIRESGVLISTVGPFQLSDLFEIVFTGTRISYRRNSVEVYGRSRGVGAPLYAVAQFSLGGTQLYDLDFHPVNTITTSPTSIAASQLYTSVLPSGFMTSPLSFKRPITETVFPPSLWQFDIPISGTLVTPSTQLYAAVYAGATPIFSTSILQTALTPAASTYTLAYTLSTNVTTTPGDTLEVRLYTQRSRGTVTMQPPALSTLVYNLSSTQYVEFNHSGSPSGGQTSDFSLSINNVSTPTGQYMNTSNGVLMNQGFVRWNTRQYGLTIQNQYNDLQTRSITYTGGLFTASDSNLKYDTQYADVSTIYESIAALPLHRYSFIRPYRDAFQVEDRHQLGVITDEVAQHFPSMIHTADSEIVPSLKTVDRVQFRYAHLAATQHIIGRISTLRSKLEGRDRAKTP